MFNVSVEGEDTCRETVLSNPENAADIFTFADDQFNDLLNSGVLLEITENVDGLIADVGGVNSGAAKTITRNGKVYAYPMTAGNGYFLYYNKKYYSEEDVATLSGIIEIAEKNGKKFSMDYSSGWYIYSFFKGAGLTLEATEDGTTNICNWNATDTKYTGVQVAEVMLDISKREGFVSQGDASFVDSVINGEVIAGINGA